MSETIEPPLTHRQQMAIAAILASSSLEEARRQLRAGKDTFYGWLKQPAFQDELRRHREAVVGQAFNRLKTAMTQAVDKLLQLLGGEQQSIQLRAAEALLHYAVKAVEQQDLERRLESIEEVVFRNGGKRWR